jgi:intracellular sulfur oxidation DsrE/DsrF family protein
MTFPEEFICDEKYSPSGSEAKRKEKLYLADAVSFLNEFMRQNQKINHNVEESHQLVKCKNSLNAKKVQTCNMLPAITRWILI